MNAAERHLEPLLAEADAVRRRGIRWLGPLARPLLVSREVRVCVVGSALVLLALTTTSVWPLGLLALSPIVWGVPHVLSDLRYLVVRPGFLRRRLIVAVVIAGCIAAAAGFGIRGALLGAAAAAALSEGSRARRIAAVAVAGVLFALAELAGAASDTVFSFLHNAVAVGLFWAWRRRATRLHLVPIALFALGSAIILLGGLDPLVHAAGALARPLAGFDLAFARRNVAPVENAALAGRLVLVYAFVQAVHYVVWLRLVPEEARPSPTPRSFRQSFVALRRELGAWVLGAAGASMVVLAGWALVDVVAAREAYFHASFFHGYVELAVALVLWAERRGFVDDARGARPAAR